MVETQSSVRLRSLPKIRENILAEMQYDICYYARTCILYPKLMIEIKTLEICRYICSVTCVLVVIIDSAYGEYRTWCMEFYYVYEGLMANMRSYMTIWCHCDQKTHKVYVTIILFLPFPSHLISLPLIFFCPPELIQKTQCVRVCCICVCSCLLFHVHIFVDGVTPLPKNQCVFVYNLSPLPPRLSPTVSRQKSYIRSLRAFIAKLLKLRTPTVA